jgi:flagellar motor component MotA
MDESNAEKDEDDGLKKSAGPAWGIGGTLIGLVVAFSLIWFVITHH